MKKNKIILLFLIILIIIVLSIIFIKPNNSNKKKKRNDIKINNDIIKDEITINVGEELPKIDKIIINSKEDLSNIDIKWNDIKLSDDNKINNTGVYNGTYTYKNKKYSIKLKVIDKESPTIDGVKTIEIYIGEKVDLYKNITIKDNSNDEIKKEIKGNYDINKKGEYNLTYVVTDKSNNKTEKEFKLIVKEKQLNKQNTNNTGVVGTTSKGYKIEQKNGIYYINGILIANKSYALPSNYNPGGLLNEFMTNYNKMHDDALNSGINLKIISGFRSYNTQVSLYNRYKARDGQAEADRYSACAGHSEHQSGLAADINSLEQSWENTSEGKWLNDNCYKYGFIIRYPKGKESSTGYMFEPWHIRYVGTEIATTLYNNGNWITLEEYLGIDSKY